MREMRLQPNPVGILPKTLLAYSLFAPVNEGILKNKFACNNVNSLGALDEVRSIIISRVEAAIKANAQLRNPCYAVRVIATKKDPVRDREPEALTNWLQFSPGNGEGKWTSVGEFEVDLPAKQVTVRFPQRKRTLDTPWACSGPDGKISKTYPLDQVDIALSEYLTSVKNARD